MSENLADREDRDIGLNQPSCSRTSERMKVQLGIDTGFPDQLLDLLRDQIGTDSASINAEDSLT